MDEIGNQAKSKDLKVQKNDGMYSKDWLFLFKYFYQNYNINDINCVNDAVGLAAFLENFDCPL